MSVRAIEAEVSIKSGIEAECTIGREVVVEIHDDVNLETLTATENGSYRPESGVDGWDRVTVEVPERVPVTEPLSVTANGSYEPAEGVDGFSDVTVSVPERIPVTESLSVTENGTYEPTEGIDGYDSVTVAVPPTVPDIEPLTVTENGIYTASGDGFNPVTVNVEAPKDPNVCEGEFIGTETGVLTIDTGYEGDSYPKAVFIYDAEGIIKEDVPRAYTITAYSALKNNAQEPTYDGDTSNNGFRYQQVYTGTVTYTSGGGSSTYIFSQTDPVATGANCVKMPDRKTLKVYVTNSTSSSSIRFRTGIRYKYQVFY